MNTPSAAGRPQRPGNLSGRITRGTTGTNRLRRMDRWLVHMGAALFTQPVDVVDLGFGASIGTTVELARRLWRHYPAVRVTGVEIDPIRVATAREVLRVHDDCPIDTLRGGFELGGRFTPGTVGAIRAANVLRQYEAAEVSQVWEVLQRHVRPGGIIIDATCDEVGRVATWVHLDEQEPRSLTVSLRLKGLQTPLIAAERLPKVLIHRNVPGEPVHEFLQSLDRTWMGNSAVGSFGARQRFIATCRAMRDEGWDVLHTKARWRLGEISVPWSQVRPLA